MSLFPLFAPNSYAECTTIIKSWRAAQIGVAIVNTLTAMNKGNNGSLRAMGAVGASTGVSAALNEQKSST